MVSLNAVKIGLAKYLEQEVVSALPSWQRVLFGTASALVLRNADNMIVGIKDNPIVKAMDIIKADGMVDIQTVYSEFHAQAERSPFTIDFPLVGGIKFDATDVEKLYKLILESQGA
jgi:hypothetical protein